MELKANNEIEYIKNILSSNVIENSFGDGDSICETSEVPIKHSFADQIYIRQMNLKKGHVIVGAIHNHLHAWFLLTGHVVINNNGEIIEHVAPCYTISTPGSQRLIYALEDSIFVNVHKNPTNTENIKELEKEIVSIKIEDYNKKNNV